MSFMEIPSLLQILRLSSRASGGTHCAYFSQPSPERAAFPGWFPECGRRWIAWGAVLRRTPE